MVSFVCNHCQETLKKAKLDNHFNRCHNAHFTCIDCNTDFQGNSYRSHTSCISEAEKYQKSVYKGKKHSNNNITSQNEPPNKIVKFNKVEPENQQPQPKFEIKPEYKPKLKEPKKIDTNKIELTEIVEKKVQSLLKKERKFSLSKLNSKVCKAIKKNVDLKVEQEELSSIVKKIIFKNLEKDAYVISKK